MSQILMHLPALCHVIVLKLKFCKISAFRLFIYASGNSDYI